MKRVIELAFGVRTGKEQAIWDVKGRPATGTQPPGAPVVLGPANGNGRSAAGELARLVTTAGVTAAGAGVELRPGFTSARLTGARGDKRDAVLAALRAVDPDRLGERRGVLVALFGANATKPVAAAAAHAITEARWAALDLASAASDLLDPEQLQTVLALDGIQETAPAPASTVADNLRMILQPLTKRHRLDILLDLWDRVAAHERRAVRTRKLVTGKDRLDAVRERHDGHVDELVTRFARGALGDEPTIAQAALWMPDVWHWVQLLNRAMVDAQCATVLVRAAIAVAEDGTRAGLERCADQLKAAARLMSDAEAGEATQRTPGQPGIPSRPGCYVRDLARRLGDTPAEYANQRLTRARDYAIVVIEHAGSLLYQARDHLQPWAANELKQWRAQIGHTAVRPPGEWRQPPVGDGEPLAARDPATETAGDLLWLADLGDALAQLHGHDAAAIEYGWPSPHCDYRPDDTDPLRPRHDSIPLAAAGAAQLVSYGGQPPRAARTWTALVTGLMDTAQVSEVMTGTFRLPVPLAEADGTTVPGTELRIECARSARLLAEWSAYMGNCIAGEYFVDGATRGEFGLLALRDPDGRIVANLQLEQARRNWRIEEFRARFNADPDPELAERVTAWVATLPRTVALSVEEPPADPDEPPAVRAPRRRSRVARELADPLSRLAEHAMTRPDTLAALATLGCDPADPARRLTALRRMPRERLSRTFHEISLAELWTATGVRPLESALAELGERERLAPLLADAPLPGSLRGLARHPGVAPARSMEVLARRIRAGLADHPNLESASTQALCALIIAGTARGYGSPLTRPGATTIPGYPPSDLSDPSGPWQQAFPGAVELGADLESFWHQVSTTGLLVPNPKSWPHLWTRTTHH